MTPHLHIGWHLDQMGALICSTEHEHAFAFTVAGCTQIAVG